MLSVGHKGASLPARVGRRLASLRFEHVFCAVTLTLFALFALLIIHDVGGDQGLIFFRRTEDFFADYFNPCKMAADLNPYWYGLEDPTPWEHGYPPLNYLVFHFLSRVADYVNLGAFEAGHTTMGLASAFIVVGLTSWLFIALTGTLTGRDAPLRIAICLGLTLSAPFLSSVERGNIILLTVVLTSFFLTSYRSESRLVRELALLALATSCALKGYPALYGILLLVERRWSDAVTAALYALFLIFFPFLVFEGGLANVGTWIENIGLNSAAYGSHQPAFGFGVIAYAAQALTGAEGIDTGLKDALDACCKLVCALALVSCPLLRRRTDQVLLLSCAIICLQTNSANYLGLYLFGGIALLLGEDAHDRRDWLMLALILVFLNPVQVVAAGANITYLAMGLSVDVLLVWLTVRAARRLGEVPALIREHVGAR